VIVYAYVYTRVCVYHVYVHHNLIVLYTHRYIFSHEIRLSTRFVSLFVVVRCNVCALFLDSVITVILMFVCFPTQFKTIFSKCNQPAQTGLRSSGARSK